MAKSGKTIKVLQNNVQKILDDHSLTQRQLSKVSGLSKGCVNQTCRQKINAKDKSKAAMVVGINTLLSGGGFTKIYTYGEVFLTI